MRIQIYGLRIHKDVYKGIAHGFKERFNTSNYKDVKRPLAMGINANVIRLIKGGLGKEIMIIYVVLSTKKVFLSKR